MGLIYVQSLLAERRDALEKWIPSIETSMIKLSPVFDASKGWEAMAEIRDHSREKALRD